MNKKKLLIIVGCILVLILVGLAAIPFLIDTQSLKTRIIAQLEAHLQRKVSVQEAEVTVFTGIGARLKRAAIFDDPRFAVAPFVTLDSLVVKPRIWPLLRGKVEIASVELDQPVIQLIKNAGGSWNFESLGKSPSSPRPSGQGQPGSQPSAGRPPSSSQPTPSQPSSSQSDSLSLTVSALRLRDGTLSVRKATPSGGTEESRYENINLQLHNISTQEVATFDLSLQLPGPEKASVRAAGKLGPLNFQQFQKAILDGKVQFSSAPVAGLSALLAPVAASGTQWTGNLSGDLLVKGTLEMGFSADGKIAYAGLGSKSATHESPRVNGELLLKGGYQPSTSLVKIESSELRMPNSTVQVSGTISDQPEASQFDLRVDSPKLVFDDVLKLASVFGKGPPNGVNASGTGKLALQVKGTSKNPKVSGEAQFSDVRLSYPGLTEQISVSPFTLSFKDNTMSSNSVQLSVGARTQLESQIAASFGPDGFVDVRLRSQKPVLVADVFAVASSFGFTLPEGTSVQNGTIDLQVNVKQLLGDKPDLHLDGQVALSGARVKTPVLKVPMDVHGVQMKFTGNSANVTGLSASLAGSNLNGQLQVSNFSAPLTTFSLHVDKLDLAKLDQVINTGDAAPVKKTADLQAPGTDAGTRQAAADNSGLEFREQLDHNPLLEWVKGQVVYAAPVPTTGRDRDPLGALEVRDSSVSIDQVVYDQLLLKQVSSRVRMKSKVVQLQDLKFHVNQGTHVGAASFDLNGAKPRYTFVSKLRDVDANEFLSQNSSLKNVVYGKFSSDLDIKGEGTGFDEIARQLKGGGKVSLVNGRITSFNLKEQIAMLGKLAGVETGKAGTEFDDLISNFTISNGRVSTSDLHMRLQGTALRATGSLGLDKSADYQISVELPSSVSKKYMGSNQLLNMASATFFANEKGNMVLPLRMTGLITSPRFALDTKMVQENLKNSFRKEGVQTLQKTLGGFLKPKGAAQEGTSPQPADKPAEKKTSPLEDLLRGVMDKSKEKKKN